MRIAKTVAAFLALAACAPAAKTAKGAFELPADMAGERILFFGAHPDDELGLAPIFAEACIDKGATCHFVVASGTASYGCFLAGTEKDAVKCGEIRREEMKASAALFGAEPEFYGWTEKFYAHNADGLSRNLSEWEKEAGGRDALVARIRQTIDNYRPTRVFALDPRHGSSCHPGHRAFSQLVVEAVEQIPVGQRPPLWFEQTDLIASRSADVARAVDAFGYSPWPDTRDAAEYFDASKKLKSGEQAYDYMKKVVRTHASQYPDAASGDLVFADEPAMMRVPLARYSGDAGGDFCDPLNLKFPTIDTPEGRELFGLF